MCLDLRAAHREWSSSARAADPWPLVRSEGLSCASRPTGLQQAASAPTTTETVKMIKEDNLDDINKLEHLLKQAVLQNLQGRDCLLPEVLNKVCIT